MQRKFVEDPASELDVVKFNWNKTCLHYTSIDSFPQGPQPFIQGLLYMYKLYCPHLVSVSLPTSRRIFFKQIDRKWAARIRAVQEQKQRSNQQERLASDEEEKREISERRRSGQVGQVSSFISCFLPSKLRFSEDYQQWNYVESNLFI